jgi:hypothetical protein
LALPPLNRILVVRTNDANRESSPGNEKLISQTTALQLLTEMSTCRSELKKLAKILVGSDPEIFPSNENKHQFQDQTVPEIRAAAARLEKKSGRGQKTPIYDPAHVSTMVTNRLINFAYLNNPPTVVVSN